MADYTFTDLGQACRQIERDMKARERRVRGAVKKTARFMRNEAVKTVPKAFGELAAGLHVEDRDDGSAVISDAPHAAAVEMGSRPHMPPIAPILAWVKLRGMQGLTKTGRLRKESSDERKGAARAIAAALKGKARGARSGGSYTPVDAAEQLAWAIAKTIEKYGSKPTYYMGQLVPLATLELEIFVKEALEDV